ncbi:MAG: sensor histidine kinase [Chloroflexota bacterium]
MGAPLLIGDRVIGVIHVGTFTPRAFSADDLRLLQLVADRSVYTIERERLLAAERARAAELEVVLDSMSDGLMVYGSNGEIVRMNETAERLLGFPRGALAGMSPGDRSHSLDLRSARGTPLAESEMPLTRALRGETVIGLHLTVHRPDGITVHLLSNASPIVDSSHRILGAVASFADITELLALQEQREDYVRMVSHDLRQPLAVMRGQGQLLLDHLTKQGMDGRTQRGLEAIVTSANRMGAMIADLVESARLEAGQVELQKQPVDVHLLLTDVARRAGAPEDVARIQLGVEEGLPVLSLDIERMERAIGNLLSNAVKYSPPETPVVVAAVSYRDGIQVSVTDRGMGIPGEDLPRVFERYYRAKMGSRREGLGLGLYIARLIVEAHGGCIWAQSEVGVGSTFSFMLPQTRE